MTRRTSCYLRHVSAHAYLLGCLSGLPLQRDWGSPGSSPRPHWREDGFCRSHHWTLGSCEFTGWALSVVGFPFLPEQVSGQDGKLGTTPIQPSTLCFINCLIFHSESMTSLKDECLSTPPFRRPLDFLMVPIFKEKVEEMSIQLNITQTICFIKADWS